MKVNRNLLSRLIATGLIWLPFNKALADDAADKPHPFVTNQQSAVNPDALQEPSLLGWQPDYIGPMRGIFDASVGLKLWPTRFDIHNLEFGSTVDLAPGVRARLNLRRQDGEVHAFEINADEAYVETYNRYRAQNWEAGASLKFGHIRYLHFPYPDSIAQFDQVPGIGDLSGGRPTDYRNIVLSAEESGRNGLGLHYSGRAQLADGPNLARTIEAYGFYRSSFGRGWRFESRLGALAVRVEPLGREAKPGGSLYLGKQIGEFNVGLLYESKRNEATYTGIMLQLRPTRVTRLIGRYSADYSRQPEGFTAQVPLLHLRINESTHVRSGDMLVGEVRAIRIRTLWQQGYVRNEYEHRLESWGQTGTSNLHCVVTEEPWYLQTEALVSPHLTPNAQWEHDRQGPGQYVQRVTYRYYKQKKKLNTGA